MGKGYNNKKEIKMAEWRGLLFNPTTKEGVIYEIKKDISEINSKVKRHETRIIVHDTYLKIFHWAIGIGGGGGVIIYLLHLFIELLNKR